MNDKKYQTILEAYYSIYELNEVVTPPKPLTSPTLGFQLAAKGAVPGIGPKPTPAIQTPKPTPEEPKSSPSLISQSRPLSPINPQWAKANPQLAAAEAEKRRIRGTSQSDNPLLSPEMRARMPMTPSVQSTDVSKLGKGNQSLVNNPNAVKGTTAPTQPKPQVGTPPAGQSKPPTSTTTPPKPPTTPTLSPEQQKLYQQGYSNKDNPFAKGRIQSEINKLTPEQKKLFQQYAKEKGDNWSGYTFESYILNHLINEGYADTKKSAMNIMKNMSRDWKQNIIKNY